MTKNRYIQIIEQTHEVYAKYEEEDKSIFYSKILMAALDGAGIIYLLDGDPDIGLNVPEDSSNFKGFHFGILPYGAKTHGQKG